MKLLVVVLCLLSERFLIHAASSQRFYWFGDYCLFIQNLLTKHQLIVNPWGVFIIVLAPLILVTAFIYWLFHNIFFGFAGMILSAIIFLYCLGPQNAFFPLSESGGETPNKVLLGNYFADVNRQLFSVIFWYIVGGPIVVLTYRLITLCRAIHFISEPGKKTTDLIEWIPARISSLLYLLVGNFQRGFIVYTQLFFNKPELNHLILSDCGLYAVGVDEQEEISLPVAENLVEHATIVFMVFIALFTLVAWL